MGGREGGREGGRKEGREGDRKRGRLIESLNQIAINLCAGVYIKHACQERVRARASARESEIQRERICERRST